MSESGDDRDYAEEAYWRNYCAECDGRCVSTNGHAEHVTRCPACGEHIDYCQGHGEIGDPRGALILAMHDDGDHTLCVKDDDGECVAE